MTREESIDIIKCLAWHTRPKEEDVEQAIKALEQEPFKPMVEIDLYSVIKQKYIEREVLDKIRAEIERERSFQRAIDEYDIATGLRKALEILDKYKAESEDKE